MNWFDRQVDAFIQRIRDSDRKKIAIGGEENPTYWRWFVWPRNRVLNVYLHNFLRNDEEDLHDHRMMNISVVLQGGYWGGYYEEFYFDKPISGMPLPPKGVRMVKKFIPRIRFPSTPHRVMLFVDDEGKSIPIWSLFIGFPHWRDWGFWCGNGHTIKCDTMVEPGRECDCVRGAARWVPWQEYIGDVSPTDSRYGIKGKGCDG